MRSEYLFIYALMPPSRLRHRITPTPLTERPLPLTAYKRPSLRVAQRVSQDLPGDDRGARHGIVWTGLGEGRGVEDS